MSLAAEYEIVSITFPAISTGVCGFPLGRATEIAVATVKAALAEETTVTDVTFCCFGDAAAKTYRDVLDRA